MKLVSKIFKPKKEMFRNNRNKFISLLKRDSDIIKGLLILKGQYEIGVYDEDVEYVTRPESFFYYFFGVTDVDCYGIIDLSDGKSTLLIPKLDANKAIWVKKREIEEFKNDYDVDIIDYIHNFKSLIEFNPPEKVYFNKGIFKYSGLESITPEHDDAIIAVLKDFKIEIDSDSIYKYTCESRVTKSEDEIDLLRNSAIVASEVHDYILTKIKPGVSEAYLSSLFNSFCMYNGSVCEPYSGIFGAGKNSAILHYNFNNKILPDGKMILIDAGSYNNFYASDLTITVPINGKFTEKQKNIYNIVLKAQDYVFNNSKIGVAYQDLQNGAEKIIIKGLQDLELLDKNISVDELWNNRVSYYFMPHGIGHYIGIATHDHIGYPDKEKKKYDIIDQNLRVYRELEQNMVMTNEPGLYFIDMLLNKAKDNKKISKYFNFDLIEEYQKEIDGVRIEDMFVVRNNGIEILSKKARSIDEVEKLMNN